MTPPPPPPRYFFKHFYFLSLFIRFNKLFEKLEYDFYEDTPKNRIVRRQTHVKNSFFGSFESLEDLGTFKDVYFQTRYKMTDTKIKKEENSFYIDRENNMQSIVHLAFSARVVLHLPGEKTNLCTTSPTASRASRAFV